MQCKNFDDVGKHHSLHYTRFSTLGIVKCSSLQNVTPSQNQRMVSIGRRIAKDGLAGKRVLNVRQIKRLAKRFGVSPAVFV